MTTYKIRLTYDKMYGKKMPTMAVLPSGYGNFFKDVDVPVTFDSLTKARAYAVKMMDEDRRIYEVQISNPHYLDVWQVFTGVKRTDNGKYYWSAIHPRRTVGADHLVNKDGSLSKKTIYD